MLFLGETTVCLGSIKPRHFLCSSFILTKYPLLWHNSPLYFLLAIHQCPQFCVDYQLVRDYYAASRQKWYQSAMVWSLFISSSSDFSKELYRLLHFSYIYELFLLYYFHYNCELLFFIIKYKIIKIQTIFSWSIANTITILDELPNDVRYGKDRRYGQRGSEIAVAPSIQLNTVIIFESTAVFS